jgi:hypothetical protein
MIGIIARGRTAWILAMVFGVVLLVVGGVKSTGVMLYAAGIGFLAFGLVLLILSFISKGQTD